MTTEEATKGGRVAEIALAILVPATALAAFSGFFRYETAQLALGGIIAALLLGLWSLATLRRPPLHRGGGSALLSLLPVFLYIFGAHLLGTHRPEALDEGAAWLIATTAVLWCVLPARDVNARGALLVGTSIAVLVVGVVGLLQWLGVSFPPEIPFTTPTFEPIRGTFDEAHSAASWLAVALPIAVVAALRGEGAPRWAAGAAVAVGAITLGLIAHWVPIAIVATAGVAALGIEAMRARGLPRQSGGLIGALLVPAIVSAAIASTIAPEPDDPRDETLVALSDETDFSERLASGEEPSLYDRDRYAFFVAASVEMARGADLLGEGAAAHAALLPRHYPVESSYLERTSEVIDAPVHGPLPIAQWWASYGFTVPLFLLLAFIFGTARAMRRPEDDDTSAAPATSGALVAATIAAGLVLFFAPGGHHASVVIVAGAALAVGCSSDRQERGGLEQRVDRLAFGAIPAGAAVILLVLTQLSSGIWGFYQARGLVYAGNGYVDRAVEDFDRAGTWQTRYATELNRGLIRSLGLEQVRDLDAARVHFRNALTLRPESIEAELSFAEFLARTAPEDPVAAQQHYRRIANHVASVQRKQPSNLRAALLLADANLLHYDIEAAIDALATALNYPRSPKREAYLLFRIGRLHEQYRDAPTQARRYYVRALDVAQSAAMREAIHTRLEFVERWIERGERPAQPDGHEHGGEGLPPLNEGGGDGPSGPGDAPHENDEH